MRPEFSGIERRLERLKDCLLKLEPLRARARRDFADDPYLRDIVERNLEVAAQACIDVASRVISLEQWEKPADAYGAIRSLGEAGVLPADLARRLAPLAGFRNVLVHEYLDIDWDQVHRKLQDLDDLRAFMRHIKEWLKGKVG